ncbi:DUF4012 domain-containing protein [Nocardioides sp. MAHUQ-72]|uniref:DUF4012 domain-containing protein n=1 Tax=unclassified Nocardioides TaxID=2615069 RepID=UPI003611DC43
MTHLPVVGDDATGVRALSQSLDTVAREGVQPLAESMDRLDTITSGGRIDVAAAGSLQAPVAQASRAFSRADETVGDLDSSGYAGPLRSRFDKYVDLVHEVSQSLASARIAAEVVPTMVGADGPRDYLLVFQNNAEIRSTGGLPGAWAQVHAEDGKLNIASQGAGSDFGRRATPVLPLSAAEREVYGAELGTYFLDAGFTPDFPRAAQLMSARWEERHPSTALDGVIALDPVAMSYLLDGTGPVRVGDTTLTRDTVVDQLLSEPYKTLDPDAQDALFQVAAGAIFDAATGDLASPVKFVQGLSRAAREGRFLVTAFDPDVRSALAGTRVEGALSGDDGDTPHVDIGLNDATQSKMSYYLRYWADVKSTGCDQGVQALSASMTVNQRITPAEAAKLPESVTGAGGYGFKRGLQLLLIRLYGPYGGSIDHLTLNGKSMGKHPHVTELEGRPVTTVFLQLDSRKDMVVSWTMHTGEGQTGDVKLGMTPSIVPGDNDSVARSAC